MIRSMVVKGRAWVEPWYQATELTVLQMKKKGPTGVKERERERERNVDEVL